METRSAPAPSTVEEFWDMFPLDGLGPPPRSRRIAAADLPGPFRALLARPRHMTEALEELHGGEVDIRVLESVVEGTFYFRRTLLSVKGRPVLLGVVRLDADRLPLCARQEVLEEKIPLGRILVCRDVSRRVEPLSFVEVSATPELGRVLGARAGSTLYGRVARIVCAGGEGIDVLEIAPPAESETGGFSEELR